MHEVLVDIFHRPPHLLACRRTDFIKKYTQAHSNKTPGVKQSTSRAELDLGNTTSDYPGKSGAQKIGIRQGGKTRTLGDCTVCGLNLPVGPDNFFFLCIQSIIYVECWTTVSNTRAQKIGIRQGGKTRALGDCTVCGLNLPVGTDKNFSFAYN